VPRRAVTDPALLAQLNAESAAPASAPAEAQPRRAVTDPAVLAQLNAEPPENPLAVAGDVLATGLSGATVGTVGTGVVGIGSRLLGRDADKDKAAFNKWAVYKPQTRGGREILQKGAEMIAPVTSRVGQAVNAADQAIGDVSPTAQRYVREFFKAGNDVTSAIPLAGAVGKGVQLSREAAAAAAARNKVARTPIEIAEASGFRIAPTSVADATEAGAKPGKLARATDALAGPDSNLLHQRHNKVRANDIAMQDIGLKPGSLVTDDNIALAKKPHAEVYAKVRQSVGTTPVDREFETAVLSAGRGTSSVLELPPAIDSLRQQIVRPMNGSQMIDTISDLRNKGWKNYLSDDANTSAQGSAMLDMADAVESHLDRAIARSAPDLAGQYQAARRGFAKINMVENARVGNDIDPQVLVRANKRSNMLDGGLKAIADTAVHFPRDFNIRPARINETGQISLGSLVAPARRLAGSAVSWTRGEARNPVLGPQGRLSYLYRGDGDSGLLPRGPMTDPSNLLPGKADTAISMGGPPAPRWPPPSTALAVIPGQGVRAAPRGNPYAAGGGRAGPVLGNTPDVALAGTRHPGGTPLGGHPEPMALADSLEAYIANQKGDGINFENVLIEPTKRRTYPTVAGKRQRGVKQGEKVGNKENMRAAPGAEERGMALELALQGKKVPKDKNTYRAREIKKEKR